MSLINEIEMNSFLNPWFDIEKSDYVDENDLEYDDYERAEIISFKYPGPKKIKYFHNLCKYFEGMSCQPVFIHIHQPQKSKCSKKYIKNLKLYTNLRMSNK